MLTPVPKLPSSLAWLLLSSAAIIVGSGGYWLWQTGHSFDELITALSWGSLICIIVGGLAAFGARSSAIILLVRQDPVAERRQSSDRVHQAMPAIFGIAAAGILFLGITVAMQWFAGQSPV